MAPNNPVLNPIDYKISRFMLHYEHNLWVNKIAKNKQLLAEFLESNNTAFDWKYVSSVYYQVVQKHYSGKVEKYTSFWLLNLSVMFVPKVVKVG